MIHTFFINATSGKIDYYQDLLTMEIEKRNLLMLEYFEDQSASNRHSRRMDSVKEKKSYFIKKWNDVPSKEGKGAKPNFYHYAKEIAEIIDSDKEVGGAYNLIVYIDLMDFEDYRKTLEEAENLMEVYRCREALRRLLRAFVHETLLKTLERDFSYAPIETLLILDTGIERIDSGSESVSYECQKHFLGLDDDFLSNDFSEESFLKDKSKKDSFWNQIRDIYMSSLKNKLNGTQSKNVREKEVDLLLGDMETNFKKKVKTVLFEKNCAAAERNKTELAKARIIRCLYLLQCVNRETTLNFDKGSNKENQIHNTSGDDCVLQFESLDLNWKELVKSLEQKYKKYAEELQKFPQEDDVCNAAKTAFNEKISYIPCKRYGLTDDGTEDNKKTDEKQETIINLNLSDEMMSLTKGEIEEEILLDNNKEKRKKANKKRLFFQSKEALLKEAREIKQTNDEFPEKLQRSVKAMLSNYAHASQSDTVKLAKRSKKNTKRYLLGQAADERPSIPVDAKDLANAAYQTAKEVYLRDSKVYTVSASNVDGPFEVLEKKAEDIEARIQNLNQSAMTACGILLLVYLLPFFLVQWRLIADDLFGVGLLGALISSVLPFVILLFVFGHLVQKEKREYTVIYKEYLESVKEAVSQNQASWENYVDVFSNKIPSVRYLYEYKTDIDCAYRDYEIDKGKCRHHRDHLERCMDQTRTILNDLDCNPNLVDETEENKKPLEIEYEKPFSCGYKNEEFYTILTQDELTKKIFKKK